MPYIIYYIFSLSCFYKIYILDKKFIEFSDDFLSFMNIDDENKKQYLACWPETCNNIIKIPNLHIEQL